MVPRMLLLAKVVAELDPCLLDVWPVFWWPCGDQLVEGMDVLDDHLVAWIHVPFAGLVVDHIWLSALVKP